mmetsp:Transcript_32207/g.78258  ORF Transcript_32207/g.78258 Transcript_32207/m.78258 type:complete len:202 (-) Transcript_32207:1005-1610(-)
MGTQGKNVRLVGFLDHQDSFQEPMFNLLFRMLIKKVTLCAHSHCLGYAILTIRLCRFPSESPTEHTIGLLYKRTFSCFFHFGCFHYRVGLLVLFRKGHCSCRTSERNLFRHSLIRAVVPSATTRRNAIFTRRFHLFRRRKSIRVDLWHWELLLLGRFVLFGCKILLTPRFAFFPLFQFTSWWWRNEWDFLCRTSVLCRSCF